MYRWRTNLSENLDLSRCDQQIPSVSMNLFEECLTVRRKIRCGMSFIVLSVFETTVWLTENLPEMYGLCWALKTVPWSEIFLEEVMILYCQVLHSAHGFVHAFLCTEWKIMCSCLKEVQSLNRQKNSIYASLSVSHLLFWKLTLLSIRSTKHKFQNIF